MHIPTGVHVVYGQRSYGGPGTRVDKPARALPSPWGRPAPGAVPIRPARPSLLASPGRPYPPLRPGVTRLAGGVLPALARPPASLATPDGRAFLREGGRALPRVGGGEQRPADRVLPVERLAAGPVGRLH